MDTKQTANEPLISDQSEDQIKSKHDCLHAVKPLCVPCDRIKAITWSTIIALFIIVLSLSIKLANNQSELAVKNGIIDDLYEQIGIISDEHESDSDDYSQMLVDHAQSLQEYMQHVDDLETLTSTQMDIITDLTS